VNVHEAKAHLSRLLEAVEVGRTSSSLEPANRSPGWCRLPRGRPGRGGDVVVSAASAWEMAIKAGLGKLSIPEDLTNDVLTMS
jgi:hypothetical protein